jgi:peroxiredoxin
LRRNLSLTLLAVTLIAAAPKVGQQAPDFTLVDQNRKPVSLAAARAHKAVLVFYRGYW